jgi:SAM-dependent methyltransferase
VAREEASSDGLTNVLFEQADAQIHPFAPDRFDAAISRTGAMFFGDPVAAFTNIHRALRLGGRLLLLAWQSVAANEWIREFSAALAGGRNVPVPPADAPGPFSFADPDRVRRTLTAAGFTDVRVDELTAPMWFGDDADDAHGFMFGLLAWMLDGLDDHGRAAALDALHATMDRHATDEGVLFDSAAWLIGARVHRV